MASLVIHTSWISPQNGLLSSISGIQGLASQNAGYLGTRSSSKRPVDQTADWLWQDYCSRLTFRASIQSVYPPNYVQPKNQKALLDRIATGTTTYVECYPDNTRFHECSLAAKLSINYTCANSLGTNLDDLPRHWPAPHFHDRTLFDSSHVEYVLRYANVKLWFHLFMPTRSPYLILGGRRQRKLSISDPCPYSRCKSIKNYPLSMLVGPCEKC